MVRLSNELLNDSKTTKATFEEVDKMFKLLGGNVLGVVKDEYVELSSESEEIMEDFYLFDDIRQEARKHKDFALADALRNYLKASGVEYRDTPDGGFWESMELGVSRHEWLAKNDNLKKAEEARKRFIEAFHKRYEK
jgi:cysteinyl-tRNA synthetase